MKISDLPELTRYLNDTLGILIKPNPSATADRLPFFLNNSYSLFEVKILENRCILAVDKSDEERSPATVWKHLDQLRGRYKYEMVYVRSQITAYNRKRLIEHKVPFIVPGNQMYLPMLGIDIREHFKRQRVQPARMNPSAQALIIYLCLNNQAEVVTPAQVAKQLGYSAMTLTRAFDELEALGIGEISNQGRERCLRLIGDKKTLWEKALPLLLSPVKRRFYIRMDNEERPWPLAGLSALAHYTMLSEPHNPVFALSGVDWKKYSQKRQVVELTLQEPDSIEIEIWSYDPMLFSQDRIIDRLSLCLSLKDTPDERIESALEHMIKELKW